MNILRVFIICSLLYILCSFPVPVAAQVIISGTVNDKETGNPVELINVLLQDAGRKTIYGYSFTDNNGRYRIECKTTADSLLVVISAFNIKEQSKLITASTTTVDFVAEISSLQIKEVTVRQEPIRRTGDTLTYNVTSYSSIADRSIGDVLKKMPGIEVGKSGEIKYNGQAINKFYIEGLDMLGGKYGIATNNVQAKDISQVEVYENHQPVKALKDLQTSDKAAINLKLKDSAKGTWNATMELGAGYRPWMWNAETVAMYFARNFQTIDTYKTNNSGKNITNELVSFYDKLEEMNNLIGVHKTSSPPIEEHRYLDNQTHTVSANTITKLSEDIELTVNAHYIHDVISSTDKAVTTYYFDCDVPLVIREFNDTYFKNDQVEMSAQFRSNKEKSYLQDKLTIAGKWNNDRGWINNDNDIIAQRFRLPRLAVKNYFHKVHNFGRFAINFSSTTDYTTQPTWLTVSPVPDYLGSLNEDNYQSVYQGVESQRFQTRNSAFMALIKGKWNMLLNAGLNFHVETLQSELYPIKQNNEQGSYSDNFRNDNNWHRLDFILGPSASYKPSSKTTISFGLNTNLMNMRLQEKLRDKTDTKNRILLRPNISYQSTLTHNLKLNMSGLYYENYGGVYDSYGGLIMTDYRVISSRATEVSHSKHQNYSGSLSYANAVSSFFWNISGNFSQTDRNLMYNTVFDGYFSNIESVQKPNTSQSYNISAKVSKRIDKLATLFSLSGGYSASKGNVLRQGDVLKSKSDRTNFGFSTNTRFSRPVLMEYEIKYVKDQTHYKNNPSPEPIEVITQNCSINITIKKKVTWNILAEHYYNGAVKSGNRNMFFIDTGISYKAPRVEYLIQARNLTNEKTFRWSYYNDITNYSYSYQLRPTSLMFTVRFSIK